MFWNLGPGGFREVASAVGAAFATPKVGRGAAYADIDNDGDLDVLLTSNNGEAHLYRNDLTVPNKSLRLTLVGTASNRDAIGAVVYFEAGDLRGSRMVKTGSSYLSQSERTLTLGLGTRPRVDRLIVQWPSGRREQYRGLQAGSNVQLVEGKGEAVR